MKNITIVTYDSSEKVKTESVNLDSRNHPKIQATPQANYELIDTTNGSKAPQQIITKRSGNNLEILFDKEASETLTIEGFYDAPNSNLIGLAEDGSYYNYAPDTVSAINSTAQVNAIDQSLVSQSLSGSPLNQPWWIASTATSGAINIAPWMLGSAFGLGIVHLVSKNDDKDKELDTTVNKPVVSIDDITGDNVLNDAELAQSTITITGKHSGLDADVDASKTSVTLTVNDKTVIATVMGNTFNANVASSDLKADSKVTATAVVTDDNDNTATSDAATKAYTLSLDTTVNKPVVSIDDITADNVLNDAELAQSTITITGKLSGLDADIDASKTSVTLTVNDKTVIATVMGNTFSANVASSDLKADSKVTATAVVTDDNDNTATSDAATKAYTLSLDTTVSKPVVSIDDVTGDNVLNDAELAQSTITITGKLSGLDADIDASKTSVTLTVNNKTVKATVTGDTFSADVNSSDLKA
ncbi:Ig-like domain-containing protein, partial [Psychrobacter phenylpyruvicus]